MGHPVAAGLHLFYWGPVGRRTKAVCQQFAPLAVRLATEGLACGGRCAHGLGAALEFAVDAAGTRADDKIVGVTDHADVSGGVVTEIARVWPPVVVTKGLSFVD